MDTIDVVIQLHLLITGKSTFLTLETTATLVDPKHVQFKSILPMSGIVTLADSTIWVWAQFFDGCSSCRINLVAVALRRTTPQQIWSTHNGTQTKSRSQKNSFNTCFGLCHIYEAVPNESYKQGKERKADMNGNRRKVTAENSEARKKRNANCSRDKETSVYKSNIAGHGLFANQKIKKREFNLNTLGR